MSVALSITSCGGGDSSSDIDKPKVIATYPIESATGVTINSALRITFNKELDVSTLTENTFTLAGRNPVTGTVSYDAETRTVVFTPASSLEYGVDHTATMTTSVTDKAGNSLASVFELHFTTERFIERVSVNSFGLEANDSSSLFGDLAISADGRYVVFVSNATNLVSDDTNLVSDIFRRDTQSNMTTRVSVNSAGLQANDASGGGRVTSMISADGRYVVFASRATNLVSGDTNNLVDIFRHDIQTGITTRVNVDSSGVEANHNSAEFGIFAISGNGRYVVFKSRATNLVSDDTNGKGDIFLHDSQTGITSRVNVDSAGLQANNGDVPGYGLDINNDGRYIVFGTFATNLVGGDTNGKADIFLHDSQTGITTRISVDSNGLEANDSSLLPKISADGRYVVFMSYATNLVIGDTNGKGDIFLHDIQAGITSRVSLDSTGGEVDDLSLHPDVSADGRYVVFSSLATNLVNGDTNLREDTFSHDTQTGITTRLSVDSAGLEAIRNISGSGAAQISADGRYVVFVSDAVNLAPEGDTNMKEDVFRVLNTTTP